MTSRRRRHPANLDEIRDRYLALEQAVMRVRRLGMSDVAAHAGLITACVELRVVLVLELGIELSGHERLR